MRLFGKPAAEGRYLSIDGLRGYLAFFVYLHHSCIWYFFLRTGQWRPPPSNLYNHFGSTSVALFFMITGFLFFSKLIDGKKRGVDWCKLFVSRFLRLVPLYVFAMSLFFLVIAVVSHGVLNESLPRTLNKALSWLTFTIFGGPNLNGVQHSFRILAGVTWTLPYEWFFYFSLPLLALVVRVRPPLPYVIFAVACVIFAALRYPHEPFQFFLGGIAAAKLSRVEWFRQVAAKKISSLLSIGCIAIAITYYPSSSGIIPLILLSIAFAPIASGNTLFGLLASPVSRTLGEITYSIYLLHGITLFVTFNFIIGLTEAKSLSLISHWLVIAGLTPVLVLASYATYRFIESPAMGKTAVVADWIRSRLAVLSPGPGSVADIKELPANNVNVGCQEQ
jgi:peptidoglycan/LPS O-acetylase OafA/YrhL